MALFMSERGLEMTVRGQKDTFGGNPPVRIARQRRVFAEFRKGGIPDWALPLALERFKMPGKPPELTPRQWLWTYDSQFDQQERKWTDEERQLIEAKLRASRKVLEIEAPATAKPWPKYDTLVVKGRRTLDHVVEQILAGIDTTGVDPAAVLQYERENLNRAEVIAAVEALGNTPTEPEDALIAA